VWCALQSIILGGVGSSGWSPLGTSRSTISNGR